MRIRILEKNYSGTAVAYYPQKLTIFGWRCWKYPSGTEQSFSSLEKAEDFVCTQSRITLRVVSRFSIKNIE